MYGYFDQYFLLKKRPTVFVGMNPSGGC